jgi:NTP pyrophosphatase (non-canonical NTP hydrolase)
MLHEVSPVQIKYGTRKVFVTIIYADCSVAFTAQTIALSTSLIVLCAICKGKSQLVSFSAEEKGERHMSASYYNNKLYLIVDGLNERFPKGKTPFQMIARLCEEAGELARAVNHFEGTGIKLLKYGEPDRKALAKEVQDVLTAALSVARYYGIEDELQASIDESLQKLCSEGYIHSLEEA